MASDSSIEPPSDAPVLSTPDARIFEDSVELENVPKAPEKSAEQLYLTYEIQRTVKETRNGRRKRVALQFPDHMLPDAPWVADALSKGLKAERIATRDETVATTDRTAEANGTTQEEDEKVFVLADTSYGSCCVDEVAAEHGDADVVVHYGRACLSPTARLPVIYCFTKPPIRLQPAVEAFTQLYRDKSQQIILMADVPYQDYLSEMFEELSRDGFGALVIASVVRDASSPLPNRTLPPSVVQKESELTDWALFHLSEPSPSLLLNISANVKSVHFYPTDGADASSQAIEATTARALRRRYALTTRLSTVPIFGILINTLSVRNYMAILNHVKSLISKAGKKSYTFVVGKVNAAKIANFSEVGGWVVIGCWESSLFESADFWKPLITPFELELALKSDEERIWTGKWSSDFEALLSKGGEQTPDQKQHTTAEENLPDDEQVISDEESAPPEFDLRTGQYVSHSRPMGRPSKPANGASATSPHFANPNSTSLTRRPKGDLTSIGGTYSPAADFFKNKRTWQGLGSDFEIAYDDATGAQKPVEGAAMETGRHGIARGYTVGDTAADEKKS